MGIIWSGKKQFLGKPWTFTEYSIMDDVIFVKKGMLSIQEEQVAFFRVVDVSLKQTFIDRLCNQGTVILRTTDANNKTLLLEKIGKPGEVRNIINKQVEIARRKANIRTNEYYNTVDTDESVSYVDTDSYY